MSYEFMDLVNLHIEEKKQCEMDDNKRQMALDYNRRQMILKEKKQEKRLQYLFLGTMVILSFIMETPH